MSDVTSLLAVSTEETLPAQTDDTGMQIASWAYELSPDELGTCHHALAHHPMHLVDIHAGRLSQETLHTKRPARHRQCHT